MWPIKQTSITNINVKMRKILLCLATMLLTQIHLMEAAGIPSTLNGFLPESEMTTCQQPVVKKSFPASYTYEVQTNENGVPSFITDTPEGEMKYYMKQSTGYVVDWTTFREHETEGGARIVFAENGDVYFDNFFTNLVSTSWIKGKLLEDGETIRVDFPQDYYDLPDSEYWGILNRGTVKYEYNTVETTVDTENNYVTFTLFEDGSIVMEPDFEVLMMWNDGSFSGFSDDYQYYEPIEPPLTMPASVNTEEWAMLYANTGCFVKIGEENDHMYISGFSYNFPDATIVGEINGSTVEISAGQFLGFYETHPMHLMFGYIDENDYVALVDPTKKFVFNFDKENRALTPAESGLIWLVNMTETSVMYAEALFNPIIKYQDMSNPAAPMAPELSFFDDSQYDAFGESYLWIVLPPFNINGDLIPTKDCYYTIYVDDEPYIFYGDLYPVLGEMGIEEITDVPYNMDLGTGLAVMGVYRGIVLTCGGMDKVSVQSYLTADGKKYYSDMMTYYVETGDVVTGVEENKATSGNKVSEEIFTLDGRKISGNGNGISIVRTVDAEGNVTVTKKISR